MHRRRGLRGIGLALEAVIVAVFLLSVIAFIAVSISHGKSVDAPRPGNHGRDALIVLGLSLVSRSDINSSFEWFYSLFSSMYGSTSTYINITVYNATSDTIETLWSIENGDEYLLRVTPLYKYRALYFFSEPDLESYTLRLYLVEITSVGEEKG